MARITNKDIMTAINNISATLDNFDQRITALENIPATNTKKVTKKNAPTTKTTKKNTTANTKKNATKKWLTKDEYKAQFTEEERKAWGDNKARERQIKNEVAAEMREEAKKNGYWKKAEYKKEFDKRVNARLEAK